MRLLISTPAAVVLDLDGVVHLRDEDASGAFGILPGHADFLTALPISVASWRLARGAEQHCALRSGVLTVNGGRQIEIATRQAVLGDALGQLETEVLANSWLNAPVEQRVLFATPAAERWIAATRLIGVDISHLASRAGHA